MWKKVFGALLAYEILNIINDEHVDALIEVDEIVDTVVFEGSGVLALEEARSDVEHS